MDDNGDKARFAQTADTKVTQEVPSLFCNSVALPEANGATSHVSQLNPQTQPEVGMPPSIPTHEPKTNSDAWIFVPWVVPFLTLYCGYKKKQKIIMAIGVFLVIIVSVISGINWVSPIDTTHVRFIVLEKRIRQAVTQGAEIKSVELSSLPKDLNKDNSIMDGWGNPIEMHVDGSSITLKSYGEDGRLGGADRSADIEYSFALQGVRKNE